MWSQLRAALAQAVYSDVDIKNAAASLALHIAQTLVPPVRVLHLAQYVENREERLAQLAAKLTCDRAHAKKAVLAAIFGCKEWQHTNDKEIAWLAALSAEMQLLDARVEWLGSDHQEKFTHFKLAQAIFTKEYDCLMAAVQHLEAQGWSCDALIHDGCLIRSLDDHNRRPVPDDVAPLTAVRLHLATAMQLYGIVTKRCCGL